MSGKTDRSPRGCAAGRQSGRSTTTSGRPVPTLRSVSSTRFNRLIKRSPRTPPSGRLVTLQSSPFPDCAAWRRRGFPISFFISTGTITSTSGECSTPGAIYPRACGNPRREFEWGNDFRRGPDDLQPYDARAPPRFQPRARSPKASQPWSVTATVSSSLMKPRRGSAIVVSIEMTMPDSSGRSES